MSNVCIRFDSHELNSNKMGWKGYNLAEMYKSKKFKIPFGFVLSSNVFDERIKNNIKKLFKDILIREASDDQFRNKLEEFFREEITEENINQIELVEIFKLLLKIGSKEFPYPIDAITEEVRLNIGGEEDIDRWNDVLSQVKQEINNLKGDIVFIRSSSTIDEKTLKDFRGVFESSQYTKSCLNTNEEIYEKMLDIYRSVLQTNTTIELFAKHSLEDYSMAILFQGKEKSLISGIGECKIKCEDKNKVLIEITIQVIEGEESKGIARMSNEGEELAVDIKHEVHSLTLQYCKKDNDEWMLDKIIDKDVKGGIQKEKYIFSLSKNKQISTTATIKGRKLSEAAQKGLVDLIIDIFKFWRKKKDNLWEQKIEFLMPKSEGTVYIVQCDNHTG